MIYSVYFLSNVFLLMRTSVYSIYKGLTAAQPLLNEQIFFAWISTFFLLILTILSFFYAGYFIYKISKNISNLTKGVDYFCSGNLDYRIDVIGGKSPVDDLKIIEIKI